MSHKVTLSPFGSWQSPLTEELVVKGSLRLSDISVQGEEIFWVEGRPEEKGRHVVVSYLHGEKRDKSPETYNVRTRVHEYGGLSYLIHQEALYFVHFADQHLYRKDKDGHVEKIIDLPPKRFACFVASPDGRYLYSVMEEGEQNSLVCIDVHKKQIDLIASGYDFYGEPTLSPDGKRLAWIAWNHPQMPWDGTDLFLADVDSEGKIYNERKIAGASDISILHPFFSPTGVLYYASDKTGFWNFYTVDGHPVCPMQSDVAEPLWVLGSKRATFVSPKTLACIYTEEGIDRLGLIDLEKKALTPIDTPFTSIQCLRSYKQGLLFIGASPVELPAIIHFDLPTTSINVLFEPQKLSIDPKFFSIPLPIKYKTANDKEAYAIFYPPSNPYFQSSEQTQAPPLIVKCHGGPTAHKKAVLDLNHQYWTTRGFAVVEVNYRGSSGYGRDYRRLLFHNWGVADVEDAIYAAKYLSSQGHANRDQVAIVGGSAGGYTVLASLAFHNFFKAGVSYYGVSDLEALMKDTHKFEAHYLDKLVDPPYSARSPIHHVDNIKAPLLLLQGGEDKIVPPAQSESIHQALQKRGIPSTYILFPHEQHGFRSKETLIAALKAEYTFYKEVFKLPPTSPVT